MCGRFVSSSRAEDVARYFDVGDVSEQALAHRPNFNTAPTTDVLTVFAEGGARRLDTFRWGLVPRWADDLRIGNRLINARVESAADKPAFRSAFRRRRCIVPADGFYEWTRVEGSRRKQPWYIHRPDGEPYAFAGLWEQWKGRPAGAERTPGEAEEPSDGGGEVTVRSVTILTGPANEAMAALHDRMPVVLPAGAWERWLDQRVQDPAEITALLVPAPPALIRFEPVSPEVNDVHNKGPGLIRPVRLDGP